MLKAIVFTGAVFIFGGTLSVGSFEGDFRVGSGSIAWANDKIEDSNGNDVKPWESFRGWSPRVPYRQSTTTQSQKETTGKETTDSPVKTTKPDEAKTNSSSTNRYDVKPWESFRGWSIPVPYSGNY